MSDMHRLGDIRAAVIENYIVGFVFFNAETVIFRGLRLMIGDEIVADVEIDEAGPGDLDVAQRWDVF